MSIGGTVAMVLALHSVAIAANAVVLRPVADMHRTASEDAEVISQAIYGSNVDLLEDAGEWAHVRTADNYTGWIRVSGVARRDQRYANGEGAAVVASLFANVYRETSATKHKPLMTIPFEARLEVTGEQGVRWLQVRLVDGDTGWIQSGDVTRAPKKLTVSETIAFSKRFLGLPYLWGGVSTFGYDCSGFTQMLLRTRGVLMPRDARLQERWDGLLEVSRTSLQPGDLVFFGSGEKITHTGMYIGRGQFINATVHQRPVVQISDLNDPHWTHLFVSARRLK